MRKLKKVMKKLIATTISMAMVLAAMPAIESNARNVYNPDTSYIVANLEITDTIICPTHGTNETYTLSKRLAQKRAKIEKILIADGRTPYIGSSTALRDAGYVKSDVKKQSILSQDPKTGEYTYHIFYEYEASSHNAMAEIKSLDAHYGIGADSNAYYGNTCAGVNLYVKDSNGNKLSGYTVEKNCYHWWESNGDENDPNARGLDGSDPTDKNGWTMLYVQGDVIANFYAVPTYTDYTDYEGEDYVDDQSNSIYGVPVTVTDVDTEHPIIIRDASEKEVARITPNNNFPKFINKDVDHLPDITNKYFNISTASGYSVNITTNYDDVYCEALGEILLGITVTKADTPKPGTTVTTSGVDVTYRTHVQSYGWQSYVKNGASSGTTGLGKRLEAINIKVSGNSNLGIAYTTHCQTYGWLPWSKNGELNGTEGEAKRLEAIKIQLTGADKDKYDVYYRVHAQSYGWLNWAKNGEPAGTAGYGKRLESIQIVVVKKGATFNKSLGGIASTNSKAYVAKDGATPQVAGISTPNVAYKTHVQSYGWQGWKYNGQMSGTSGMAKRLEGINIKLTNQQVSGGITYRTHVQTYGWQGWKSNGEMSGTSGEAKRLEAIEIKLTGAMADKYDVYYRVHAQSYGWLGWAKNGAPSGTAGYAKRLEGIQIVLVEKGGKAPGNVGGITSVNSKAYIQK